MTYDEIVTMFSNRRGTTFAGLDVTTEPKLLKKHRDTGELCPFSSVRKHAAVRVMLGANYEKRVQKITDNPDFVAGPHAWADEHIGYLQRRGGEHYLQCMIQDSASYYAGMVGGVWGVLDKHALVGYLPRPSENPTNIATYKISSIQSIRIDARTIEVETVQSAMVEA
jgi:hypothetical protein